MPTVPERQDAVNTETWSRSPEGDAFSAFSLAVIRLHGHLTAAGDALARPVGQSSARWQVLAGAEGGRYSVADVARLLGLARQSVQRVADLLEAEGLISYSENPRHRRARLLVLTDVGRAVLASIQDAQAEWANALGAELGARRLREATKVLEAAHGLLATRRRPPGPEPGT